MGKTAVTKQDQEKAGKLRNWQIGRYSIISAIVERQPISVYVHVTVVYSREAGQSDSVGGTGGGGGEWIVGRDRVNA